MSDELINEFALDLIMYALDIELEKEYANVSNLKRLEQAHIITIDDEKEYLIDDLINIYQPKLGEK